MNEITKASEQLDAEAIRLRAERHILALGLKSVDDVLQMIAPSHQLQGLYRQSRGDMRELNDIIEELREIDHLQRYNTGRIAQNDRYWLRPKRCGFSKSNK